MDSQVKEANHKRTLYYIVRKVKINVTKKPQADAQGQKLINEN